MFYLNITKESQKFTEEKSSHISLPSVPDTRILHTTGHTQHQGTDNAELAIRSEHPVLLRAVLGSFTAGTDLSPQSVSSLKQATAKAALSTVSSHLHLTSLTPGNHKPALQLNFSFENVLYKWIIQYVLFSDLLFLFSTTPTDSCDLQVTFMAGEHAPEQMHQTVSLFTYWQPSRSAQFLTTANKAVWTFTYTFQMYTYSGLSDNE